MNGTTGGSGRPVRPLRPVGASVGLLAVWWLVAHNGGSGWIQVLGDAMAAVVIIGLLGPFVALRRARIAVTAAPSDAQAGTAVELTVTASSRVRLRPLDPPGPTVFAGPTRGRRSDPTALRSGVSSPDVLTVVPPRRGVIDEVTVEVATAAPFALLWWRRPVRAPLRRPLLVAPRLGRPLPLPWDPAHDQTGESPERVRGPAGEPRGVRVYEPGDSRRRLHWPLTAHTGRLMVRETESPAAEPVTITVTLPDDPDAAERLAEAAFGTAAALLERDLAVVLVTAEAGGARVAPVGERCAAGRRLARAVAGGSGPPGVTTS